MSSRSQGVAKGFGIVVLAMIFTLPIVLATPHRPRQKRSVSVSVSVSVLASLRQRLQASRQGFQEECQLKCEGHTLAPCNNDDDCVSPLKCLDDSLMNPCDGNDCFCSVDETLTACNSCLSCAFPNETCTNIGDFIDTSNGDNNVQFVCMDSCFVQSQHLNAYPSCNLNPDQSPCASFSVLPTPTPTPSSTPVTPASSTTPSASPFPTKPAKCIAASAMAHLPISHRVFRTHHVAAVRCDTHDNCATKGHMVVFDGTAVTMERYCRMVEGGCVDKIMPVNSPRYRRGLRLASNSPRLQFTAFAASFESQAEELVLALAIHLGL